MPRKPRGWISGGVYHIASQSSDGRSLYRYDADRLVFLQMLADVVRTYELGLVAYTLMSTHYHLLVEIPDARISSALKELNGGYSRYWSRSKRASAHHFKAHPMARHADSEDYLSALSSYVPNNPVRAGLCSRAEEWAWSSFSATIGLRAARTMLTLGPLIDLFGGEPGWQSRYHRYVRDNVRKDMPWGQSGTALVLP
jgi:REP element-mobilizing transposase RayT